MKAIAFSGGRDSWACLWLNEPILHSCHVIWVNAGSNIPEVLESVNKARQMCANFHEVKTDKDGNNIRYGFPADVVPIDWTALGHSVSGEKDVMIQSYLGCCYENISGPLHSFAKRLGVTELIRGQRIADTHKGAARDGDDMDGITYRHPIEGWSTDAVTSYLSSKMELPRHFHLSHSSVDCFDCTAYTKETRDKAVYLEKYHPVLFAEFSRKKTLVDSAIATALRS